MSYHVKTALSDLWKEKWINLLGCLSMGVGLFMAALALAAVINSNRVASALPERFSLTVFLKQDATPADIAQIQNALRGDKPVKSVAFISSDKALADLKEGLGNKYSYLLEGLDSNPLQASFDVKLRKEYVRTASVKALAASLKTMSGVDSVNYGKGFLDTIQKVAHAVSEAGLALFAGLLAGAVFICYSTIKILFYRKSDEIETLKLLGATGWFVRAPFLLEGAVMGFFGGLAAGAACFGAFDVFLSGVGGALPLLTNLSIPPALVAGLPVAGMLAGMAGALIAIGRVRP
ncbi:MAG: permease-like cell division protein FtsX [Actinomycetota bacterium]|nr:permease-like cell division protein FtsX [Actinomycetota bacterium]